MNIEAWIKLIVLCIEIVTLGIIVWLLVDLRSTRKRLYCEMRRAEMNLREIESHIAPRFSSRINRDMGWEIREEEPSPY